VRRGIRLTYYETWSTVGVCRVCGGLVDLGLEMSSWAVVLEMCVRWLMGAGANVLGMAGVAIVVSYVVESLV
jgi:hypothetical protein